MEVQSQANAGWQQRIRDAGALYGPGVLVAAVVAMASQFLSEHYGAPAMLMALLIGIAFHFLSEDGPCVKGIEFSAKTVLRIGVALLGVRISFELIYGLGIELILLIVFAVILTILFGLAGARLLGRGWRLALITGGSVGICGASAAMAIAAILPKNEFSERNLIFTVLGVTLLSTLAMIFYPIIVQWMGFDARQAGAFLGGTIHDVAQVVGAGFSVSQETGETATLVKLIRVSMLAPVVLVMALVFRYVMSLEVSPAERPPLVPTFVLGFLFLATLNSVGLIPSVVADVLAEAARWALLASIAAVGMKTSVKRMLDVGGQAVVLIVAETVFLAGLMMAGLMYLSN